MSVEANTSAAEAGCFLSVRSSCDRCRVQKLKCSVLSGSGACERCTRAKLPCIFGRRTRTKRSCSSSNDEARRARLPATPNTSPVAQAVPLTPFTTTTTTATGATPITTPPTTTPSSSTTAAAACLTTAAQPIEIMVPSTMTTVSQGDYLLTPPGPYIQLAGPVDSAAAGPDTEPGCHYMRSCDNSSNVVMLHDSFTDVLESDSDLGTHGWPHFGFDVADVTMFDSSQMNLPRWPSSSSLSTLSSHQLGSVTTTASSLPSVAEAHTKAAACGHGPCNAVVLTSQRLITLISEIQQRLRKLEDSPWHAGSARSLDDYPVGSVLQLSQQFSSIAGLALSTGRIAGGMVGTTGVMMDEDDCRALAMEGVTSSEDGMVIKDDDLDERKANSNGATPTTTTVLDTATILLLLSGYMWLVRIFDMALSHFQKHLNRMPNRYDHHLHHDGPNTSTSSNGSSSSSSNSNSNNSSNSGGSTTSSHSSSSSSHTAAAVAGRSLRLGELQWANGALDLQKIHIAVSMLLDALHDVEGHMGRGGGAVRDLAVTLLLNDPTRRGDGGGFGGGGWHYAGAGLGLGLGKRIMVVKELLRDKMGL